MVQNDERDRLADLPQENPLSLSHPQEPRPSHCVDRCTPDPRTTWLE